jgi:Transmembrane secretion effector
MSRRNREHDTTPGSSRSSPPKNREIPPVALTPEADTGPVVVRTTYSIPVERGLEFIRAMGRVRMSRLRTGATQWGLFRDGEQPCVFEEIFVVASWEEHLRQHRERMTATDRGYEEQAKALSDTPPQTWHLLPADPDRQ